MELRLSVATLAIGIGAQAFHVPEPVGWVLIGVGILSLFLAIVHRRRKHPQHHLADISDGSTVDLEDSVALGYDGIRATGASSFRGRRIFLDRLRGRKP